MNVQAKLIYVFLSLIALVQTMQIHAQSCDPVFSKRYPASSAMGNPRQIEFTADDKILLTAEMQELPYGTGSSATILKLDGSGNILAGKKLSTGSIYHNKRLNDGNFLLLDYIYNGNRPETKLALVKYDANLNIIWTKTYALPFTWSGNCRFVESADGTLFLYFQFSYTESGSYPDYSAIAKLDPLGNFQWCKTYRLPGSQFFFNGKLAQSGDNLYFSAGNPADAYSSLLYKVDKATGNMVWAKRLGLTGSELNFGLDIAVLGARIILAGGVTTASNNFRPALLSLNEDGSLAGFSSYSFPTGTMSLTAIETAQSKLIVAGGLLISGTESSYQLSVNPDLSVSSGLMQATGQAALDLAVSATGMQAETGAFYSNNYSVYDIFVQKRSADGKLGTCPQQDFRPAVRTENLTISNLTLPSTNITLAAENSNVSFSDYAFAPVDLGCTAVSACTALTLTGTVSICKQDSIYTYKANRSLNCTTPVTWKFDATAFQQTASTDSTIQLRPLKTGQSQIIATMKSDCGKDLADTMAVSASLTDLTFTLGNDRTLCTDSIINLQPGKTFSAYTWQDGSTNPAFRVTAPGLYHLSVSDGCGNTFRDSIVIGGDAAASLGLPAESTICAGDALKLTAADGFTNYQWSLSSGAGIAAGQTVSISPPTDTRYFVKAIKANNCPALGSTNVLVLRSPAINLGADTSFCDRDSIRLTAGSGFSEYLWSTGSVLPQVIVNRRGTYSVQARSANGCFSRDTLVVQNVYANPQISLGPDLKLCTGDQQQLLAGNFSGYRWQDGSREKTLTVSKTGTYWVTVQDIHQCRGSDTVKVLVNDCVTGVHIPNAFTPDGNGNNDLFRAIVSGELVSFDMMIYNRFGQKVFSTNDKTRGWDGTLNGRPQDAGTYVYAIKYQLPNAEPVLKKGVFVLIR